MVDLLLHRLGMLSVELTKTPDFPQTAPIIRTCLMFLAQRMYGLQPKTAKNNKFVENELGNWAYVNQITEKQILMLKKKER